MATLKQVTKTINKGLKDRGEEPLSESECKAYGFHYSKMDKIKSFIVPIAKDVYWFYQNYKTMRGFRYWLSFSKVFWTTSYEKIRCYGGEEEGGWYYTNYCYKGATFTPFGFGRKKAEKQYSEQRNIVVYFETRRGENENMEPQRYE